MPRSRHDLRRALEALAFRQSGYFTAAQALDVGYSYQAQKHHVDSGNWVRVDRGIFRLPHWPSHADDTYVRWSLWSKGRAVLSHESAMAVHGLSDADPRQVHLTVGPDFHAVDSAVTLHVAELETDDVEQREGWKVTTPARTIVDAAAAETPQEQVTGAVRDAIAHGRTSRRRLRSAAARSTDRAALRIERALAAVEAEL